jgi:hypothetical protein
MACAVQNRRAARAWRGPEQPMASHPRTSTDPSTPRAHLAPVARARRAEAAPLARIDGRVLDEASRPVAGAEVTLADGGDHRAGPPAGARRATTDRDGRFALPSPRGGGALLLAHGRGHLPDVQLVSRRTRHVVLRLARAGALRGQVTDAGGTPRRGVEVVASSRQALDASSAVSGEDGRFALEGLRPSRWRVTLAAGGAGLELEVLPGEVAHGVLTVDSAVAPTP